MIDIKLGSHTIRTSFKYLRRLYAAVLLLLGFSLWQYLDSGTIRWPTDIYQRVTATLSDYAQRPDAGWRQAASKLETLSANREGRPLPDFDLSGRVVRVTDGDTVSILDSSRRQHKVRLWGIDAPEQDQPYGKASKKALSTLVADSTVDLVIVDTDQYGRKVATLYREGKNINIAMVTQGYAWWYQHFAPHNRQLAAAEQSAREQGLGLWAAPHPVPPWDWRRGRR